MFKNFTLPLLALFGIVFSVSCGASGRVYDVSRFGKPKSGRIINILNNGSFEGGKKGWKFAVGSVVARPFGRNGNEGLRLRRSNPAVYSTTSQQLRTAPNTRYEFGVLVKTKDIKGRGGGARMCIEYYDKVTNKYINGIYHFQAYRGTNDWKKISGEFFAPADVNVILSLYITKGMVGEAFFDDAYVKPVGASWNAYMCNPAYNAIALDVPEKSVATFNVSANNAVPKNKRLVLQLTLDNGFKIASIVRDGVATFDFSDSKLTMGKTYNCRMDLLDISGRARLYTRDFPLQVRAAKSTVKQAGSIVRFNKNNVAIVDGKKFMPLGFYVGGATDRNIELVKQAGGTVMLANTGLWGWSEEGVEKTRQRLDKVDAAGLKLIFTVKNQLRTGYNAWTVKKWGKYTEAVDIRGEIIKAFRDHPAMLSWFIIDETSLENIKDLIPFRQQINQLDPNHPVSGVHCNYANFGDLSPCWDVAGIDPYVVAGNIFNLSAIQFASNQSQKTRLPVWGTVEAFHNGTYDKPNAKIYKMPTEEQTRGTMLQLAGQGAKGFILYLLDDVFPPRAPEPGMFEKFWPGLCRTFKLFRELEPYIVSDYQPKTVSTSVGSNKVGAYRLTDDNKNEVIILTVVRDATEAVIKVRNPAAWTSRYGKTELKNGKLVFKGQNMDSDVLFKKSK